MCFNLTRVTRKKLKIISITRSRFVLLETMLSHFAQRQLLLDQRPFALDLTIRGILFAFSNRKPGFDLCKLDAIFRRKARRRNAGNRHEKANDANTRNGSARIKRKAKSKYEKTRATNCSIQPKMRMPVCQSSFQNMNAMKIVGAQIFKHKKIAILISLRIMKHRDESDGVGIEYLIFEQST